MSNAEIHLYIDDSGSRDPDRMPKETRRDELDYFALGGVLINEEDVDDVFARHKAFCEAYNIDYPLHSWAIRGGRGSFGWLKKPEAAFAFLTDLEKMLVSLPNKDRYQDRLWLMCRTAYSILIERAAKYARSQNRKLRVFFERAGKAEDRDLISYARSLKKDGMPFDENNSAAYASLRAEDFREIVRGEPRGRTKATPMIQIADLVLYPIAKGGYDPAYRPYKVLLENKRLIDALLASDDRPSLGIKYSCFERVKEKGPD